jgi:hypothetical protein
MIFDESVFPFATLHPNAGVRYTSTVLLTPGHNEDANLTNAHTMNTLPVEFPMQVLECVQIPRLVAADQVPGGLSDPSVPTVAQFLETSSSAAGFSHQDPL